MHNKRLVIGLKLVRWDLHVAAAGAGATSPTANAAADAGADGQQSANNDRDHHPDCERATASALKNEHTIAKPGALASGWRATRTLITPAAVGSAPATCTRFPSK